MTLGLTQLLGKQNALIALMRGPEIEKVLLDAMEPVEHLAVILAPFDLGELRRSIQRETARENNSTIIGRTGTNIAYGRRHELGFHGTDSLGRTYDYAGKPYLGPAAISMEFRVVQTVKDRTGTLVERIANGR